MNYSARGAAILTLGAAMTAMAQAAPTNNGDTGASQRPQPGRALGYYDATLRRVVLLTGAAQPKAGEQLASWSWSGARWNLLTESGPLSRGNGGAAYDARRRRAILTGGAVQSRNDSTTRISGETEEGTSSGWTRMIGDDITPRDHLSLVYDEARGKVMIFGGIPADRAAPWPSDTWELRSNGWTRIATDGPAGRARAALAYDRKRRQVVLFGGVGAEPAPRQPQQFFNDTWIWNGTTWRKAAEGGPRGRYAHGMVFDERAGVVLLYSGAAAHRDAPLSDMWQWDGKRWTEIHLTGPTPGYRYQPVMVYDRARGETVLFGGNNSTKDDTWEWDGRHWKEILP